MYQHLTRRRMLKTVSVTAFAWASVPLLNACGGPSASTATVAQPNTATTSATSAVLPASASAVVTSTTTAVTSSDDAPRAATGTTPASTSTPGAATVPPKALNGAVEVWGEAVFPFDKDVGGQIVQELESTHPGLKIAFSPVDDFDGQKLQVTTAGGTPPDLDDVNGILPQGLALAGLAGAFDPYLATSNVLTKADLWPSLLADATWEGKLYGIGYAPDIRIMYLNADRYQQAGLDIHKPPQTWNDLEAAIGKTLQRSGDQITVAGFSPFIGSGVQNLWLVPFWQLGGELLSADGAKVTIANDAGLTAWTWLLKIINQQGGWPALQAFQIGHDPNQLFATDLMGNYYATNAERAESFPKFKANPQFGYTTYPLPLNGRRVTFGGVHTFVMPKSAKQADGAWLFLEALLSKQNNLKFALRYDRVPVRQSVAYSDQYIQGDPFRKLVGDEMPGRHWLIAAPGAGDMRNDVIGVVADILQNNLGVQAALQKAQAAMQLKLDKALHPGA
jgi:multiple sugar transport system substrate-binding protein